MKAVIMAGGSGTRLRPLTCTVAKPMARISGKPLIKHILSLLQKNGFDEACITLGYLSDSVEKSFDSGFESMKLSFVTEDDPLGTAGSVRNAADGWDETFLVISGDAMCDFNLADLVRQHRQSGAVASIVATQVADPREYGVIMTDSDSTVTGFVEKPSWSQAVSGLVNTGIYILEPECLDFIDKGKFLDFSKDIFPLMMEKSAKLCCLKASGYWCDIGNISAYMQCQREAFDGRIRIDRNNCKTDIYSSLQRAHGDYSIIEPVYISKNADISKGCVIGPYTVVDDGAFVDENCRIRYSVVLENACISSNCALTGALICNGASLKKGVTMFEGSVAGAGCVIGKKASISPGCQIWPGKVIHDRAVVNENVKYGSLAGEMISDGCVCENSSAYLSAETCLKLGEAIGSSRRKIKAGIANDGAAASKMLVEAIKSGLLSAGSCVWDFASCYESQINFYTACCGLDAGVYVSSKDGRRVKICGEGGMPLSSFAERDIASRMSGSDFSFIKDEEIGECMMMSAVKMLYRRELLDLAPNGLSGVRAQIRSENSDVEETAGEVAATLGLDSGGGLIFYISKSGATVTAQYDGNLIDSDTLLIMCCLDEMKKGNDVSVPYDAPELLDIMADAYNCRVLRYLSSPSDRADSEARKLGKNQFFVRDGLFATIKILSLMKARNVNFGILVNELPERCFARKTLESRIEPSKLAALFPDDRIKINNKKEGIRLVRENGSLLVVPYSGGGYLRLFAETVSTEAAKELIEGFEEVILSSNDE